MSRRHERTREEREAARLERQRRRGAGAGEGESPPQPPAVSPPSPPAAVSPPSPPAAVSPPPPPPAKIPPEPAARPPETEPELESVRPPATMVTAVPPADDERDDAHTDGFESISEEEVPAGTKRVTGLHRARSQQPRPARPSRRPRRTASDRSAISRGGRIGSVAAIVLAVVLIWFVAQLFQPFHGAGGSPIKVVIPSRLSSGQVGDLLARDGVVSSSFFFNLRTTLAGQRGSLRSGTYELRRDMSYGTVLKTLTTAPPAARVSQLTVIEGRTRTQLDKLLHSQGIQGSFLARTRSSPLLNPARYGAPPTIRSLEGFLFPSTYQLREPISIAALVADQLRTFRQRFATVDLSAARRRQLTPYEVLIIASIIQGEARTAHDRALISSVIYNRMLAKMPLQMDDTVRFATGNYDTPITVSQLASRSPWNTYTNPGLPPTPINSPGLASIQAAAQPASTSYLFFVVKPCGNGSHAFASSYAQFQALQSRYNAARAQRGGHSPEFCR